MKPAYRMALPLLAAALHAQTALAGFTVSGDPRSESGATWTYQATREGINYDVQGITPMPRAC